MMKITFLVSGGGGNLKFFFFLRDDLKRIQFDLSVIADRDCDALEFAKKNGLPAFKISYKQNQRKELLNALEEIKPDYIVTNWHKIIDSDTVSKYYGRMVNLHYSLLPSFGGLIGIEPIKQAYQQGCKFIGPTCHLVDEGVDTGEIVAQAVFSAQIPIEKSINVMFRKGCLTLLNGIISLIGNEEITVEKSFSSYLPPLPFDESVFDECFWDKVAKA